MKPFIRFSEPKERNLRNDEKRAFYSKCFWDFDDLIQKELLRLLYEIASPNTIVHYCVEQWKNNLESLYENQKKALESRACDNIQYSFDFSDRMRFIVKRTKPGDRLLYVGCGSGRECLVLAKKGIGVTGIDTMPPILGVAKGWASHVGLPLDLTCMDVIKLGFKPDSFDGFLLEFYGWLPPSSQTAALQGLADILHQRGQGFIIASRKKYASFWFLMNTPYPPSMVNWLIPQTSLDFSFSKADNSEERLSYGLYNRSHTLESLSSELSHTLEVAECLYEQDPRYIMAVVKPKNRIGFHNTVNDKQTSNPLDEEVTQSRLDTIGKTLGTIESLCDLLEIHTERVCAFFKNPETFSTNKCLQAVSTDFSQFIRREVAVSLCQHPLRNVLEEA